MTSSSNDANMEEIPLEDDERDSIEYRILMAYAQRRLSADKYGKLLQKEANVQKSLSLIRRRVETENQEILITFFFPSQSDEKANVDHIADRLAKLITSRFQPSPSEVSFKLFYNQSPQRQSRSATDGSKDEESDEEKIIQTIVALLRQSGDQLEEKIEKDQTFYQYLVNRLSYAFFEGLIDLTLTAVSAESTSETEGQAQCTKAAFALELATRLTAVDSHPMNMILGFGVKYLREHFTPWIQYQGGWEKALTLLDQEEIE
ncbi:PREDICTED: apoptosis facilitator Bcl-2-like protein 14 [Tinamus guttatus]|uniref:apoptosis facilitator Bcl-2-like protein 14 n=1 Tax=Tinamus guttatus TaxID=94827 RepID=UPI00052E757B|nr:PREDICTED: apoptosis facilitator Bcl-2-like protein 14 [Tinamus guttatus]